MDLYWTRLGDPHGSEEQLLSTPQPKFLNDWSRDDRFLLYHTIDPRTPFEVVRGGTGLCRRRHPGALGPGWP